MARERYLVNAGEDTIHSNVIELRTAKEKRENWWFYHKTHLIVGILLAALAVSLVYSIASQVEPDYTIGLLTSYSMPSEAQEQISGYIERYAEDRNGDGKVVVQLSNYVMNANESDLQMIQASMTRFAGDAALNSCMIYIHDEEAFEQMQGQFQSYFQYNDGQTMPEDATDFENAMRDWSELKAFEGFQPEEVPGLGGWTPEVLTELCGRLRVSVRAKEGSGFASDEELVGYYEDSLALLDRLMKDEPLNQEPAQE